MGLGLGLYLVEYPNKQFASDALVLRVVALDLRMRVLASMARHSGDWYSLWLEHWDCGFYPLYRKM